HVVTTSPTGADEQVVALPDSPSTDTADAGREAVRSPAPQTRTMAASAAANPATPELVGAPSITSRAGWCAVDSRMRSTDSADHLRSVVFHHGAGTNGYRSSVVAELVRGIHQYHTATLGWPDIVYIELVSKYGQVFEVRDDGLHRNIASAHAV